MLPNPFRKSDHDLFARVFDDGASGDARMEWLRDGLKDLREVPPHGLSNERLRDRLLGTSLAPASKAAPWWMWAWAPIAAATLAVVILPRLGSRPTPAVITDPGTVALNRDARPPLTVDRPTSPKVARESDSPSVASANPLGDHETFLAIASNFDSPSVRETLRDSTAPRKRVRGPGSSNAKSLIRLAPRGRMNEALMALNKEVRDAPRPEPTSSAFSVTEAPAMAFMSTSDSSSDPLVLLTPEIDANTGAVRATEVDSPANLSVGG